MTRLRHALILLLLIGFATAGRAQEVTPAHREAARDLLELTRVEQYMEESMNTMIELQIEANPALVPYQDVFREFLEKHLSWERVEPEFVALYIEHFSETELRQLTRFFSSEIGQKAISLQGVMFNEGAQIGQKRVQENIGELEAMIVQRAQELEQGIQPEP